jgi:hypothetical protein
MKKYIQNYISYITGLLENPQSIEDIEDLKTEHLRQIQFIQHERFIHLIVTCLFAILLFISIGILLISGNVSLLALIALILCLLCPYISHYFFLENSTQKLYSIYNKICSLEKKQSFREEKSL